MCRPQGDGGRDMPRQRRGIRGDAPQGYLFRFAPMRGHRPLRPSTAPAPCPRPVIPSQCSHWRGKPFPFSCQRRPLAATYLCRVAAKARFDNRLTQGAGVSKEGGPQPSLFGRSRMGDFQGGRGPAPPEAGLIQIVANGHTAFTGGTRGRRAGTRSVRGPLAGRRAGRGHDWRPHGHPAACCADCRTPNRKAGFQQRARRRRHLPPQFNPCRRRREQGSVPRKRPRRRAPPSCGGDAGD